MDGCWSHLLHEHVGENVAALGKAHFLEAIDNEKLGRIRCQCHANVSLSRQADDKASILFILFRECVNTLSIRNRAQALKQARLHRKMKEE